MIDSTTTWLKNTVIKSVINLLSYKSFLISSALIKTIIIETSCVIRPDFENERIVHFTASQQ